MTRNEVNTVNLGDRLLYGDEEVEVVGMLTRASFDSTTVYTTSRVDNALYPLLQVRGLNDFWTREITYGCLTFPKRRLRMYQETLD